MADEKKTSLTEYWNMLALHDWFLPYSDDPGMLEKGCEEDITLLNIAKQGPAYAELYKAYKKYIFGAASEPSCPS